MLASVNPAQAIVYGQRVNCFEATAGSCRSGSEKENLRTERKQNHVIKNEKEKNTLTIIT